MLSPRVHFIDSVDELDNWIEQIFESNYTVVGADIEANSMYRYHQKICLLQLSLPSDVLLVDIQNIDFTDSLRKLMTSEKIIKVFQDMKYDLSMFWFEYQCKVSPLFDISIADRLIRCENEYRSQNKLIEEYLGINFQFAKSIQKSNWGLRPLTDNQLDYAVADVKYLIQLYHILKEKLIENNVWDYFETYMQNIEPIEVRREFNPLSMWKLKGVKDLNQIELNRLHDLVVLRNEIAEKIDRPIHWIIDNTSLVGLVKSNVKKKQDLFQHIQKRQKSVAFIHSYANEILEILNHPISNPREFLPPKPGESLRLWLSPKDFSNGNFKTNIPKAKKIKAWSKAVAEEYEILPEMVLQKHEINFCSSLPNEEIPQELSLPGIPPSRKQEFIDNFNEYMCDNNSMD